MRFLKLLLCVLPLLCACPHHAGAAFFTHPSAGGHPVNVLSVAGTYPRKIATPLSVTADAETPYRDSLGNHYRHRPHHQRKADNNRGLASLLIILGFCALVGLTAAISPDIPDTIAIILVALGYGSFISSLVLGIRGRRWDKKPYMARMGMSLSIFALALGTAIFIAALAVLGVI